MPHAPGSWARTAVPCAGDRARVAPWPSAARSTPPGTSATRPRTRCAGTPRRTAPGPPSRRGWSRGCVAGRLGARPGRLRGEVGREVGHRLRPALEAEPLQVAGEPLGDLHALHDDGEHLALLGDQRRLAGNPVVEAGENHPRLRRRLQDRLLRSREVATEVGPNIFLPPADSDRDGAAAVETSRRELCDGLPKRPRRSENPSPVLVFP